MMFMKDSPFTVFSLMSGTNVSESRQSFVFFLNFFPFCQKNATTFSNRHEIINAVTFMLLTILISIFMRLSRLEEGGKDFK